MKFTNFAGFFKQTLNKNLEKNNLSLFLKSTRKYSYKMKNGLNNP